MVEVALSVLLDRRKKWEKRFVKKFGVPLDSAGGISKMIRAFCVVAQCNLDVEGVGLVKWTPPPGSAAEVQELKKLVEDQRMAMEGLPGVCARQRQTTAPRQTTGIMGIMGNYGELWGIMGNYGELWGIMGNYGGLWGNYGEVWGSMVELWEIMVELWGILGNYGELWGIMGDDGGIMGNYGELLGSYGE